MRLAIEAAGHDLELSFAEAFMQIGREFKVTEEEARWFMGLTPNQLVELLKDA